MDNVPHVHVPHVPVPSVHELNVLVPNVHVPSVHEPNVFVPNVPVLEQHDMWYVCGRVVPTFVLFFFGVGCGHWSQPQILSQCILLP